MLTLRTIRARGFGFRVPPPLIALPSLRHLPGDLLRWLLLPLEDAP